MVIIVNSFLLGALQDFVVEYAFVTNLKDSVRATALTISVHIDKGPLNPQLHCFLDTDTIMAQKTD